jgi:hypothetical protein
MLTRNPRLRKKRVKALTDPKPEFVSLVFAGANKTPFRAMRSDESDHTMTIKADTHAIARIEFDAEQFADEAAVTAWLADGGYEGFTVAKTDTGFAVAADVEEGAEVVEIEIEERGLKMQVVSLKADEDEEVHPGAEETAAKSEEFIGEAEMRQRCCGCYDAVESTYGKGDTLKEVVANNFGHVPPGLLDLSMAMYDAVRNNLRDGNTAGAKKAITEFGKMMDDLLAIFPGADVPTHKAFVDAVAPEVEMTKTTEESTAETTVEETAAKAEGAEATETVATEETAEKADEAATEEVAAEAATEGETAAKTEGAEEATTEEVTTEAAAEEPAAKSDDPLAALIAQVGALATSVEELRATVTQKSEEADARVAAIDGERQTRKGADVDETGTASVAAEDENSASVAELRTRSVLGMRRPASK